MFRVRKILSGLIAALAFTVPAANAAAPISNTGELLDRIVAVVNEGVVLQSELDAQMRVIVSRLRQQDTTLPPMEILQQQILERLVVTEIQQQRAERLGVRVSDQQLNEALSRIAQQNGTTLGQLPGILQGQGIDYPLYREEIRRTVILDRLRQRDVMPRISVTRQEVEDYLARQSARENEQEYNISHILISLASAASPEEIKAAEDRVTEISERVRNGEDFGRLAVAYSSGQTALEGGLIGWRKTSELPSLFVDRVLAMSPGDVSEPVRSPSGFHLVFLNETRGAEKIIVNQRHARHILVTPNAVMTDEEARGKIEQLRARILDGESFEEIAREESDDKGTANQGGDLGWADPGTFVPQFEAVLDAIEIGQLSEPFRSQFGWHILELLEVREHDATDDASRNKAFAAIQQRKLQEETELWLQQLRDEAFIETRL